MAQKSDRQLYNEAAEKVKEIIISDDFRGAKELADLIDKLIRKKNFQQTNPELYNNYQKLIYRLSWVALPLLKKEEVFSLFNDLDCLFCLDEWCLWSNCR